MKKIQRWTRDHSTNSWWLVLVAWGEGWHNNHHAHPVSARHGLKWYEIDLNWYGIWVLKELRLARQVYYVELPAPQGSNEVDASRSQSGLVSA